MTNLLEIINTALNNINQFASNYFFLLIAFSMVIGIKLFIFISLISRSTEFKKNQKPLLFLLLFLIGSIVPDLAWILMLSKKLFFQNIDYRICLFSSRISWVFYIVQYQFLALFIERLSSKHAKTKLYEKILITISTLLVIFFTILSLINFNCKEELLRPSIEIKLLNFISIYLLCILLPIQLFLTIRKVRKINIPRILKRQIKILIQFIILPILISDTIQLYPGIISTTVTNNLALAGISALLLTYAIFHCMRKIMGLRFLNFDPHVRASKKFSFIDDFKNILDQFAQVSSTKELGHITQNFFKDAFNIQKRQTRLYVRIDNKSKEIDNSNKYNTFETEENTVENFVGRYNATTNIGKFLLKNKIIIADELEFSNFYEENEEQSTIVNFMKNIAADIFIPTFENNIITSYIIVQRHARINSENKNAAFYSNVERDQMLVFSNYLGNIIRLLQVRSFESIIHQEKELREELYGKHQEINQYKESIRSFLKNNQTKKIGVIFYRSRRFVFGNQVAQDLITINLNTYNGHPITKKLKKVVFQVLEYKSPQTCFIQNDNGERLVVSALLNTEQNNVIMIVYYPEISDILKKKITLLKDPSKWDYLLYLETTKSGQLVNELFPGSGETLLNFKIDLLKTALGKKAILLDIPDQDLLPTVDIIHCISLKETLHILDLQKPSNNFDTAIKLFGINPIFGIKDEQQKPLLKKLDNTGTLFIKNIHLLELETQKYLAEFIKYGFFRIFKGESKTFSNVRIICSTNINLKTAIQDGNFSKELFDELNKTAISMPSLMTLDLQEFDDLATSFTQQSIKSNEFQHVLELTNSEKIKLAGSCPTSFAELKNKIGQILIKKSKQSAIYEEAQFDPAYDISDPQLVEAIRLGKHALRDKRIMSMLWNKFKNQNQIANLLGVNRSSVNRRCKDYNLIPKNNPSDLSR